MTCLLSFSYLSFAQDSVQVDSNIHNFPIIIQDSIARNLDSTSSDNQVIKKNKISRKRRRSVTKDQQPLMDQKRTDDHQIFSKNILSICIWILLSLIILFILVRTILRKIFKSNIYEVSGYSSRRDYYRNVYLKSEAWQRKRFVVLKRDNWKCVYCGQKATEVHHTKYAKINIGNEPIEWLVSICKSCHDSLHEK